MKNLIHTILLVTPLFFFSACEDNGPIHGCLDSQACNYNSQASIDNNSCEYTSCLEIGDQYEGGIIFYLNEAEGGLVAALEGVDGTYGWGCSTILINANGESIGAGYQNSIDIISACSESPIAASVSLNFESEGYNDWYLPSIDELYEMKQTIGQGGSEGNIGGFSTSNYWSSTERDQWNSYSVYFSSDFDFGPGANAKQINNIKVRPIRSF